MTKGFVPDRYKKELALMRKDPDHAVPATPAGGGPAAQPRAPGRGAAVSGHKKRRSSGHLKPRCNMESFPKMEIRAVIPSHKQDGGGGPVIRNAAMPRRRLSWMRSRRK